MPFVLDASTTLAWFLPGQRTPHTDAILQIVMLTGAVVPALWIFEISAVLLRWNASNLLSDALLLNILQDLATLPVEVHSDLSAIPDIVRIGKSLGLTGYDAAYLELADRVGLPLATNDERLKAAAQLLGVPLVTP